MLEIDWVDSAWPTSNEAGYGKSTLPLKNLFEFNGMDDVRPAMVYVYKDIEDEKKAEKAFKKLFGSDDLAVASRFFTCFRIDVADIENAAANKQFKKLPYFAFLDADGRTVHEMSGRVTHRKILKGLGKTYTKSYAGRMSRQVKQFADFLKDFEKVEDKIADQKRKIETLSARETKKPTKRNKDKVAEARKEMGELETQMKKLYERRDMILAPAVKKATVAKGN